MFRHFSRVALFGVAIFPACASYAIDPVQKIDPNQAVGAIVEDNAGFTGGVMSAAENDKRIVQWLSIDNRGIVECAKFAADHSSNESVKAFAREMAAEHGNFQEQVFGKRMDQAVDAKSDAGTAGALIQDQGRIRDGKLLFRPTDFVAVKAQVCRDMQDRAKKQMESLTGPEFDHAFVAHTVFGHEALIATVDVLDNDSSDGLQDDLQKFHELLDKHLTHARELQKQVRAHDTAARPATSEVK